MSLTEEQQAFLLRKLRTWFAAQDVDKNGYITAEDFEEIAKRFVKYGKLEEKKGKEITEAYYGVIKNFGLENRGDKMTLERYLEGAMKFRENPRSRELTREAMSKNFDAVDIDNDGIISFEEFRLYFKSMGINESNAKVAFDGVDTDHGTR